MLNYFNTMSDEEKSIYLNGEFPLHYIGPDNDLSAGINAPEYPLYLFADIALMSIDSLFIYEPRVAETNKKKAQNLKVKLEELREKLVTLNYSKNFDSRKHISPRAWDGMCAARGCFSMSRDEKEGYQHYSIHYTIVSDDGVWRNGDYYYDNVYRSYGEHILFEEDQKEINNRREARLRHEAEEYYSHYTKYFKDGKIPSSREVVEDCLIDPNIDERIKKELCIFVLMYHSKESRGHIEYAHSDNAEYRLDRLKAAERAVQKDKEERIRLREEKDSAIDQARARYKQRNFFWKLLNRKLNPEKLDFESMETPEIQELYTGGKKRK